MPDSSYRKI